MTRLDSIQQIAVETFAELGSLDPAATVVPTLLIRDQEFVGFRFQCEGMEALWRANGNVLAFFDEREADKGSQDWIRTKSSVILHSWSSWCDIHDAQSPARMSSQPGRGIIYE